MSEPNMSQLTVMAQLHQAIIETIIRPAEAAMTLSPTEGVTYAKFRPPGTTWTEESGGWMDLNLDRLRDLGNVAVFALAHTRIQNGDVMAVPEIIFTLSRGLAVPTNLTDHGAGIYSVLVNDVGALNQILTGERLMSPSQREVLDFAVQWLKNIKDQGYEPMETRHDTTPWRPYTAMMTGRR